MNAKQKIIETLKGKRTEQVWELIEKAITEVYEEKSDFGIAKEEFLGFEEKVNNKSFRYIIVEHYNIEDGFNGRFYGERWKMEDITAQDMIEDYFSDCDGGWEEILLVDMKEFKCYLLDKEVKYYKKEVKTDD